MNVHNRITDFELVLQYCLKKIKDDDRGEALVYGKLSGFYENDGYLTVSGENLAAFIKLDLAHERVG